MKVDPRLKGDKDLIVSTIRTVSKRCHIPWVAPALSVKVANVKDEPPSRIGHAYAYITTLKGSIHIFMNEWEKLSNMAKRTVIAHEICHLAACLRGVYTPAHGILFTTIMANSGYLMHELCLFRGLKKNSTMYRKMRNTIRRLRQSQKKLYRKWRS